MKQYLIDKIEQLMSEGRQIDELKFNEIYIWYCVKQNANITPEGIVRDYVEPTLDTEELISVRIACMIALEEVKKHHKK